LHAPECGGHLPRIMVTAHAVKQLSLTSVCLSVVAVADIEFNA